MFVSTVLNFNRMKYFNISGRFQFPCVFVCHKPTKLKFCLSVHVVIVVFYWSKSLTNRPFQIQHIITKNN